MVLLDSRGSKDSNEILFVIFGLIDYLICILQDLDRNRYLKIKFKLNLTQLTGGGLTRPRRGSNLLGDTDSVWNRTWTVGLSGVARFRLDRGRCLT
jgi:hypothetical protein